MKKQLLSMLLVIAMLLSLVMTTAVGAADGSGKLPFTDVKETSWYTVAVRYVFEKGFMKGLSSTEFGPEKNMTRAEFVTLLSRLAGLTDEDIKLVTERAPHSDISLGGVARSAARRDMCAYR